MASTHFPNKVRRDEPWKIVKGTKCVFFTSNLSLLPPRTSQRQSSRCQEPPDFLSIMCEGWVTGTLWMKLVTLRCYLELSFAFKPFFFCGVASIFFFLKRFSSRTQERSGMGARVYDHPLSIFSGVKEKLRVAFMFHFGENKRNGRMEGWKKEMKVGRMERRKGRRETIGFLFLNWRFPVWCPFKGGLGSHIG